MYARLCRKMMEQISPKVQDESIKNTKGKPIAGGQLFRKYLLNRCQEDFERGWASKEAAAAAAAAKAKDDEAVTAGNADKKEGDAEIEPYSEEYYASQKAKRQGLGLVKFFGELFKLQMLTERIMHECVKKLLNNVDNPEEEEIESLCKLLTTVGRLLDTARGGPYMDIYFTRMRELTKNPKVNSRMQYSRLHWNVHSRKTRKLFCGADGRMMAGGSVTCSLLSPSPIAGQRQGWTSRKAFPFALRPF
jgi:translation initiation factor 4G